MPMQLTPKTTTEDVRDTYIKVDAQTLAVLADQLYQELSSNGYSLLLDDVVSAMIIDTQYYASWAVLECQRSAIIGLSIDENLVLEGFEWAIIEPVLRAHCDVIQSRLVEGSRSLGGDGFGLNVSEARQIYADARITMQNEAFCEPPSSFTTFDGL